MRFVFLTLALSLILCCENNSRKSAESFPVRGLVTDSAMVVSAREEASRIGVEILRQGGNAYDAAVAVEFALAVAYPYAGNLAGGGFLVYRTQYGELGTIDFREKAPLAAHRDMYLDAAGNYIRDKSSKGALAVGVPGTVAGLFEIHNRLGSLPMEVLIRPAIELARKGVPVTAHQLEHLDKFKDEIELISGESSLYTAKYKPGDTIKNSALAKTLERISENGVAEFYRGETATILVDYIQSKGGIISLEDMAIYEPQFREPMEFTYKDLNIITMPPPSSGGVCMAQILGMLEAYPLVNYGHNSVKYIQILAEAEKRAYADRSYYLGDPDFVDISIDSLIHPDYLKSRMNSFSFDRATPSSEIKPGGITTYESDETTHFSIVDQFGNAAALTTTLNSGYGSKLYISELGIFLNNQMDDFSAKPGEPNIYGLLGGESNAIEPQKRMLSSMTPTIIEKDGKLWMVVGTPGGATIITSVVQTILNVYEFDMHMQQAVSVPRFHHQWLPDALRYEKDRFSPELIAELEALGYPENLTADPVIGKVDAILILPNGKLEGGADPRGDDRSAGI